MNIYYTVYQTTNQINDKIYIGVHKTENPNDSYLGSNRILKDAVKKYGQENFTKEVLYIFDNEEDAFNKERELVSEEFVPRKDTYNIGLGGKGWTGLGLYTKENKIGYQALPFDEKSKIQKRVQSERDPEKRQKMCSEGGKVGGSLAVKNKTGIHNLSKEQRSLNGKRAADRQKELGVGFFSKETQSELGKRGGPKNKGFRWYNDGEKDYKYTKREQDHLSYEDFLQQNPQYTQDRLKRDFKERPKSKGKRTLTNGIQNIMLLENEASVFLQNNPDYRYGRTNFVNNKKKHQ